jgi:two-component system, NtrC family, sensor kinase
VKLSTRLLLPLLASVAVVMLLYGSWALRQRESSLVADAARETQAYATALGLALERAFQLPELGDVQEIIERASREPSVYGVIVYDTGRTPRFRSDAVTGAPPLADSLLARVLARGEPLSFERFLDDVAVYSAVRPLRDDLGSIIGALEVAQPLTFLEADKTRVRQRYFLNTITLVVAVVVLVVGIVHRFVSRPLERFSAAVRALGTGDLSHRLDVGAAGGELADVASELNRMAAHLEAARSDLVRQSEERLALERRLRQSERLAAMGELAAGVAHEIAAPLHVIRGRADLLLRQGTDAEPGARNLAIITQQIDRITFIVRNLMGFARRREPRTVRADLVQTLHGVAEFVEAEIERAGITLHVEGPPVAYLMGDPDLLHQVFLNLIINAVHALESSGSELRRIDVRVMESDGVGAASSTVRVEVSDTGPGIPPELIERVFDPFFTTKNGSQGTGLGLCVARAIVEDHGGTIDAASRPSGGAVFRVTLPREPAPVPVEAVHA